MFTSKRKRDGGVGREREKIKEGRREGGVRKKRGRKESGADDYLEG